VIHAVQSGERPPIPPDVPPQLANIIKLCWEPADKRPTFDQLSAMLSAEDLIPLEIDAVPVCSLPLQS